MMIKTLIAGLLSVAVFAPNAHAAGTGVEKALEDAKQELEARAEELRGKIAPAKTRVVDMSATIDELYVLLRQKYAEGDNDTVPTRRGSMPENF